MIKDIWIQLTFNSKGDFEGKDEFVEELRKVCVVQERKEWYPSACSGYEFIAEVLFNSTFGDFIQNIVLPGLAWDVLKLSCSKIWEAFRKFTEKNEGFELQTLTLTFNDATIVVNETLDNHYGFLVRLFQILPKHWVKFQELGIKDIIKIELPLLPNDESVELLEKYCTEEVETPDNCLWIIQYELGLESCYYSPAMMQLVWS